jgi:hypothetical protein
VPSRAIEQGLFERLAALIDQSQLRVDKETIVDEMRQALVRFSHVETKKNLDQRF